MTESGVPKLLGETSEENSVTTGVFGTGAKIGYARISTRDRGQSVDRQISELTAAGCVKVYSDEGVSGAKMKRPQLDAALAYLRPGDTLVVVELSRLGRDTVGLVELAASLEKRGVGLQILNLAVDTSTPSGRLIFSVIAAVSQMERELLRERVMSGLMEAKRQGRTGGRTPALTDAQRIHAVELVESGKSYREVAEILGCSLRTARRVVAGK